jgi:hypothetical protein
LPFYSPKLIIVDIQELSVTIVSEHGPGQVSLVEDQLNPSKITDVAFKTFVEQQKWHLTEQCK